MRKEVDWDERMISLLWIDSRVIQCNRVMSSSSGTDLRGEGMSVDFKYSFQFQLRKRNHSTCYSPKARLFSLSFPFDWY